MNDDDKIFNKGDRVRYHGLGDTHHGMVGVIALDSPRHNHYASVWFDNALNIFSLLKEDLTKIPEIPAERAPFREEGRTIRPEDVQIGDTIKLVAKATYGDGTTKTVVVEGQVDSRNSKGSLWTSGYICLWSSSSDMEQHLTLLSKAPDCVLTELLEMTQDTVLSWRYGKEDTLYVAVKTGRQNWQVVGASGATRYDTAGVRTLIERNNDNYSTLKEGK